MIVCRLLLPVNVVYVVTCSVLSMNNMQTVGRDSALKMMLGVPGLASMNYCRTWSQTEDQRHSFSTTYTNFDTCTKVFL